MKRIGPLILLIVAIAQVALAQSSSSSPETGHKVLGTYFPSDIDSVSLSNGNLHVGIPLFSLPGRELPLSLGVSYDSRFFERRTTVIEGIPTEYWEFFGWRKTTPIAGSLTASYSYEACGWNLTFTWVNPEGAKHKWTKCVQPYPGTEDVMYNGHTIESTGSEFMRLETGLYFWGLAGPSSTPAVITLKNGTRLIFRPGQYHERVYEAFTTNGNQLTVTGVATSSTTPTGGSPDNLNFDLVPLSDTTGRSIGYSGGNTEVFTLTDVNGQAQIYRIYQFEYNSKGLLSKLIFPTGAYVRYVYLKPTYGDGWHLQHRYVSTDGTIGSEKDWLYSYDYQLHEPEPGGDYIYWLAKTVITDPSGGAEEHGFAFPVNCPTGNLPDACDRSERFLRGYHIPFRQRPGDANHGFPLAHVNPDLRRDESARSFHRAQRRLDPLHA